MNEELIRKAFNEGTMRLANLPDLAVGTRVMTGSGYQGEVLVHHANQVIFGWDSGVVNTFTYDEQHCVYLAPLCFVEGRPVYKGDVLYRTEELIDYPGTKEVVAKELDPSGKYLIFECGADTALNGTMSKLSWTKPVTTININGHEVPLPERAPQVGTKYFSPSFQLAGGVWSYTWAGDVFDDRLLSAGMVHLTEDAARKHAEALASFTREPCLVQY